MTDAQVLLMDRWYESRVKAAVAAEALAAELVLRREVFASLFPSPKEGVNAVELGSGYTLKGTYKLDRKVDEALLPAVREQLAPLGISADTLVRLKPELVVKVYRTLTEEAQKIFDGALITKPSTPTLEVVAPK